MKQSSRIFSASQNDRTVRHPISIGELGERSPLRDCGVGSGTPQKNARHNTNWPFLGFARIRASCDPRRETAGERDRPGLESMSALPSRLQVIDRRHAASGWRILLTDHPRRDECSRKPHPGGGKYAQDLTNACSCFSRKSVPVKRCDLALQPALSKCRTDQLDVAFFRISIP